MTLRFIFFSLATGNGAEESITARNKHGLDSHSSCAVICPGIHTNGKLYKAVSR